MSRRRVYAELEPDEYGNVPDIRFLPHLFKHKEPPRKAIGLALVLLAVGVLFLTLGVLALQGKLHADEKGTPRQLALALTILGSITFIPGFYYTRVAYYAYKGYTGYSFDDIPEVD